MRALWLLVPPAIWYALFAFVLWEPQPGLWDSGGRYLMVVLVFASEFVTGMWLAFDKEG